MRLADALAALDPKGFERLCRRRGVALDPRKRISPAEQAARQLADRGRDIPVAALPPPARAVALFLATHPVGEERRTLGGGALPLLEEDLVFPVPGAPSRVAMPTAYRVMLPPAPTEDRRSARVLLGTQREEVWVALGQETLGRRPVGPAALYLEPVLEGLERADGREARIAALSPKQRRLLEAIEARGGQLDTDELLALEGSPSRVAIAGGTELPTRSASHQLFLRGLLLPRARGLWALPTEVAAHVGAPRRAIERDRRRALLAEVARNEDLSPTRAELADDPAAPTLALLAALAREGEPGGPERAVRRSALKRAAQDAGVDAARAELLVALARGAGAPLLGGTVGEVGARLFAAYRAGGAWDEARVEPDAHRLDEARASVATPTGGLRDALLELLEAMPKERFAPVAELARTAAADLRNAGAERRLEAARRAHPDAWLEDPVAVVERVATESLPALGAVDRGRVDGRAVVRLSARARRWMEGGRGGASDPSRWEGRVLHVGAGACVRDVLAAAEAARAIAAGGLVLRVERESVERVAIELGPEEIERRFAALAAPLDPAVEHVLTAIERAPRLACVPASGFIAIDDPSLRERILAAPAMRELVIARSPEGGVLIREGVSRARLARALGAVGVVLE